MKILQINKFLYLRGGAERHFLDVSSMLAERGHEVIHFCMRHPNNAPSPYEAYFVSPISFDPPTLTTVFKFGRVVYSPEARRKLKRLLEDTRPDVAHVHLMYHHLSPSI